MKRKLAPTLAHAATSAGYVVLAGMAVVQANRAIRNGGADLGGYVAAGRALLAGGYDTDPWQNAWPPFFSFFMVPAVWLSRALPASPHHLAVVFFLNLALSVALVVLCARSASPARRPTSAVYVATGLFAAPYLRHNLYYHQVNVLLAVLCASAFARLARRRDDALAGTLVGLAASVKVQPVFLLPYFWRRPRALAASLVTGAVCAVAPAAVYGFGTLLRAWRFWVFEAIPAHAGGFGVSIPAAAHNLASALAGGALTPLPRRPWAEGLGSALALGIVLLSYLWIQKRIARGPVQAPVLDLALLLPAAVLASPLAWRYHLVALVPAQAALAVYLLRPGGDRARRRGVTVLVAIGVLVGYASELGALQGLGAAIERAESLGMSALGSAATMVALALARTDTSSDSFAGLGGEAHTRGARSEPDDRDLRCAR